MVNTSFQNGALSESFVSSASARLKVDDQVKAQGHNTE